MSLRSAKLIMKLLNVNFSVGGAGLVAGASYSADLAVFEPGKN